MNNLKIAGIVLLCALLPLTAQQNRQKREKNDNYTTSKEEKATAAEKKESTQNRGSNAKQKETFLTDVPAGNYSVRMGDIHLNKVSTSPYCFTIIADPHLDNNTDTVALKQIMLSVARQKAAFTIDMGDTFMVEKYGKENYQASEAQFQAVRYYYSLAQTPLYLVMGNHDASYRMKDPTMYDWAALMRKKYFNASSETYYSFVYGNVQFIVLDPYLNTPPAGSRDPEARTLGTAQIEWLKETLAKSRSKYKFVFTHTLVGGADLHGRDRGGAEVADKYEWGRTIQPLLEKYRVNAVFHGHDHLFAHQNYHGVIYQCVPQPAPIRKKSKNDLNEEEQMKKAAAEYGYLEGTILSGGGYLKITVDSSVKVEYITLSGIKYSYSIP